MNPMNSMIPTIPVNRMQRTLVAVLALVALGGLAAGCGDDSSDDDEATEESQPGGASDDAQEPAEPEPEATLAVGDTGLGQVLVDGEGKTLYLYSADQGTTTAVPDAVLEAWPPLTVESEDELAAGEGIDEAKLGTAEQADGRLWVIYNDHLLYRYSGDSQPGQTAGHALANVWYALTPDGEQLA